MFFPEVSIYFYRHVLGMHLRQYQHNVSYKQYKNKRKQFILSSLVSCFIFIVCYIIRVKMRVRKQLVLKMLEVKNEEEYRLMLAGDEDALYPPWFYTWVEDNKLAAFAWPQTRGNLEYLWEDGIRHIVTLCPEKVPELENSKFEWTYIPITECHAPTIEDIFKFIRVVQWCRKKNQALGVHCRMGLGRTGVMVAAYLIYFHGLDPEQALRNLRYNRPGSVDSIEQEECILNYRPNARIANEKRITKITRRGDHFLTLLKGESRKGVWGLPRAEYAS